MTHLAACSLLSRLLPAVCSLQNFIYLSAHLSVIRGLCKATQPKHPPLSHLLTDTWAAHSCVNVTCLSTHVEQTVAQLSGAINDFIKLSTQTCRDHHLSNCSWWNGFNLRRLCHWCSCYACPSISPRVQSHQVGFAHTLFQFLCASLIPEVWWAATSAVVTRTQRWCRGRCSSESSISSQHVCLNFARRSLCFCFVFGVEDALVSQTTAFNTFTSFSLHFSFCWWRSSVRRWCSAKSS